MMRHVPPLQSGTGPDWWFESQGPDYWLGQFFNTPLEVHTFELGVFVGVLFAVFVVRGYPKTAVLAVGLLLAFLFGSFDVPVVCTAETVACAHVLLKPWYFLGGVLVSLLVVVGLTALIAGRWAADPLAPFRADFERIALAVGADETPDAVIAYLIRQYDETAPGPLNYSDDVVARLSRSDDVEAALRELDDVRPPTANADRER